MNWRKAFEWILTLFVVYLIYEVVRKIAGGSLGYEEIMIGLLVANLGYTFHMNAILHEHIGWDKGKGDLERAM